MRIISGKLKGRKLQAPKNLPVRPTTDFAKEALFNILRSRINIDESAVMDLFAGTGNMGFEFISRGAPSCLSIDQHSGCVNFIRTTAKQWEIPELKTMQADVLKFLKKPFGSFDIIFADPPYLMNGILLIPDLIFSNNFLKEGGLLIVEHSKEVNFSEHPQLLFSRKYGNVNFTLFSHETS